MKTWQVLAAGTGLMAMVMAMGGQAWAQVHGAPTTPAPPGQSTMQRPGPPGLPATIAPGNWGPASQNNQVAPGQPSVVTTNAAGNPASPNGVNLPSAGGTNAAGVPVIQGTAAPGTSTNANRVVVSPTGVYPVPTMSAPVTTGTMGAAGLPSTTTTTSSAAGPQMTTPGTFTATPATTSTNAASAGQ